MSRAWLDLERRTTIRRCASRAISRHLPLFPIRKRTSSTSNEAATASPLALTGGFSKENDTCLEYYKEFRCEAYFKIAIGSRVRSVPFARGRNQMHVRPEKFENKSILSSSSSSSYQKVTRETESKLSARACVCARTRNREIRTSRRFTMRSLRRIVRIAMNFTFHRRVPYTCQRQYPPTMT